jgi:hypothetical protein
MSGLYLVAYYYSRPKTNRIRTERPGWMKLPGTVSYDEQVTLTKNLKNRDIQTAQVILDMVGKRVIKNGFVKDRSFDDLFLYYYGNYPQYTKDIMNKLDPGYLTRFASPSTEPVRTIDTGSTISST